METSQELNSFINSAQKSRKYPDNTAGALRGALRIFEAELNEEERSSVDLFKNNLEKIYLNVFQKNKTKMSAGSLATYKSRVIKLISDYEKYGKDPAKMTSWNPAVIVRKPKQQTQRQSGEKSIESASVVTSQIDINTGLAEGVGTIRHAIDLGKNRTVVVVTPADLTSEEVVKVQAYIDYLNVIAGGK